MKTASRKASVTRLPGTRAPREKPSRRRRAAGGKLMWAALKRKLGRQDPSYAV